jgi:hypothetical protein
MTFTESTPSTITSSTPSIEALSTILWNAPLIRSRRSLEARDGVYDATKQPYNLLLMPEPPLDHTRFTPEERKVWIVPLLYGFV